MLLEDLKEEIPNAELPWLDKGKVDLSRLSLQNRMWRDFGYMFLRGFLPDNLIENYRRIRDPLQSPGGWGMGTPYMHFNEIKDICLYFPLMQILKELIGDDMGLHLNLTGYVSTERNWHQDTYLNEPCVKTWYLAVWMALEDIDPVSGPFEFIPGSHIWPCLSREKVKALLPIEERDTPHWPKHAEKILNSVFEEEIKRRVVKPVKFIAKKGDVLIWHSRLAHRGSEPLVPGTPRRALISHYSALSHRNDMPRRKQHYNGGWYFVHDTPLS